MAVSDLLEFRGLLAADLLGNGATRVETAARRRIDGRRRIAGKDDALASLLNVRIRHGNGGQQRLSIRMMGLGVERLPVRKLDHLTQIHNGNAIGDVLHNGKVVSDEQIRGAKLVLELFQQVQDLSLDGDVQSGNTTSSSSRTRSMRSSLVPTPWMVMGSETISPIVIRGLSDA